MQNRIWKILAYTLDTISLAVVLCESIKQLLSDKTLTIKSFLFTYKKSFPNSLIRKRETPRHSFKKEYSSTRACTQFSWEQSTFTFIYLANYFIQSYTLHSVYTFDQFLLSPGIEPMTLAFASALLYCLSYRKKRCTMVRALHKTGLYGVFPKQPFLKKNHVNRQPR